MNRKIVAMLLVVSMVLGIFGLAAAVENTEALGSQAGESKGVSGNVQEILFGEDGEGVPVGKPNPDEEPPYGPPEFVDALKALAQEYRIMARDRVQIDGNALVSDVPPVNIEGRIRIPLRAVSDSLGATVVWDEQNQQITISRDGKVITITIGDEEIDINGTKIPTDVKPQIFGNRAFVSLRFVAEALGDDVNWDPGTGTAMIRRNDRAGQEVEEEE